MTLPQQHCISAWFNDAQGRMSREWGSFDAPNRAHAELIADALCEAARVEKTEDETFVLEIYSTSTQHVVRRTVVADVLDTWREITVREP